MSKKRGGGRGRGGGPGKRKATTPVGGVYKDSRRNINGEENYDDEEDWTLVISNKKKSPARQTNQTSEPRAESSTTGMSFADAVAGAGAPSSARRDSNTSQRQMEGSDSGGRVNKNFVSKFVTPPPQGSMRDEIVIEIQKINGAKFIGQLGFKEAKYGIF